MTIAPCGQTDPHEHHVWTPEPRAIHGPKCCPGVGSTTGPDGFTRLAASPEAEFYIEKLRRALDNAELRIERTERLIDSWEHDAPKHSNPVFIGRLRETLRHECLGCGHIHTPDGCSGPPTPSDRWAGVSPAICDCDEGGSEGGGCPGCECGEHEWLDRPESDTRECLICGAEVAG